MTMDLFWATAYERFYYDEDLIRKQLEAYQRHIERLTDPAFRALAPGTDWEFELFSAYSYLAAVQEFLYWNDTPQDILAVLNDAVDHALQYVMEHPDNFRHDPESLVSAREAIRFYSGETTLEELLQSFERRVALADPNGYDRINMDANLLPVILVLWMCRQRPEVLPACHDFLKKSCTVPLPISAMRWIRGLTIPCSATPDTSWGITWNCRTGFRLRTTMKSF